MGHYVFEVVQWVEKGPSRHVGYMRAHFRTKQDACTYYARHNPHMRHIAQTHGWESDWDPQTHLKYIIREFKNIEQVIPPFDPKDEPVVKSNDLQQVISTTSKFLK